MAESNGLIVNGLQLLGNDNTFESSIISYKSDAQQICHFTEITIDSSKE